MWEKTKDPKYGKEVTSVDSCIADLKDNFNRPIVESWSECYFDWSKPKIEIIWAILKTVTPRESDFEWIKNAVIDRLSDDAIGLNNGKHTLIVELSEAKDKVTFEMDYERTLDFPAEIVNGGLKITLPEQRPEYPYADGRRKLFRVERSRGGNDSEPIKSDIIQKITREDELYQAIYRIRPFNEEKPKKIYVWGIVPEEINDELQYQEIEDIDLHIKKLKQELIKGYNPENHFVEGKEITEIQAEIVNKIGCGNTTAGAIINKFLDQSTVWTKGKRENPGFKRIITVVKQ